MAENLELSNKQSKWALGISLVVFALYVLMFLFIARQMGSSATGVVVWIVFLLLPAVSAIFSIVVLVKIIQKKQRGMARVLISLILMFLMLVLTILLIANSGPTHYELNCKSLAGVCISEGEACSNYNGNPEGSVWIRHPVASCPRKTICCIQQ